MNKVDFKMHSTVDTLPQPGDIYIQANDGTGNPEAYMVVGNSKFGYFLASLTDGCFWKVEESITLYGIANQLEEDGDFIRQKYNDEIKIKTK